MPSWIRSPLPVLAWNTVGFIGGKGEGYPSDLKDAEWARVHPLIPKASPGRRPRETDMRAAMNAILYLLRVQDRDANRLVLDKIRRRFPWLEPIWADGGSNAWQVEAAVAKVPPLRIEIVKQGDDIKGFGVLPRRWVVERTFSWFGRNRRLAKNFENLATTLETFVTLASIQLALKRLARE